MASTFGIDEKIEIENSQENEKKHKMLERTEHNTLKLLEKVTRKFVWVQNKGLKMGIVQNELA